MVPQAPPERLFPVARLVSASPPRADLTGCDFGLPLPRGWCVDVRRLGLVDDGDRPVDAEARVLARWPDQSIQWCLFHCRPRLDEDGSLTVGVRRNPAPGAPAVRGEASVKRCGDALFLAGCDHELRVPVDRPSLFDILSADGTTLAKGFCSLVVSGSTVDFTVDEASHRTRCGSRGVVSREVRLVASAMPAGIPLQLSLVLRCCPEGRRMDGSISLHNTAAARHPDGLWDLGDANSLPIDSLTLGLRLATPRDGKTLQGALVVDAASDPLSFSEEASITQYASGGEHWDSPVHVDTGGELPMRDSGYRLSVDGDDRRGGRATPRLLWHPDEDGPAIGASLAGFWEEFPSALAADGEALALSPFAAVGYAHELQPGERKTREFCLFIDPPEAWLRGSDGVTVTLDAEHLRRCAPPVLGAIDAIDPAIEALTQAGVEGPDSFFAKREAIDEFGWRHFGDLYADHETDGYEGDTLFVSHYNNQYDPLFGFLRRFLRSGDGRWFSLADDLARHTRDIDIYRTTRDRPEYNHGLFWHTDHYLPAETSSHRSYSRRQQAGAYEGHSHGGGPGGQHCYTTGLLLHYLMTGEDDSRTTLYGLRDWIERVYEGGDGLVDVALALRSRGRRDLKNRLTGRYPLDRGVANYLNALLDCYTLDQAPATLQQVGHILRHTLHPGDDIAARELHCVEDHWYYIVLLQALCRYLHIEHAVHGASEDFLYARDALLHYADWMLEHEAPYLDRPDILEFPNFTWAAQDLRKANVLFEAAHWAPDGAAAYAGKARAFVRYVAGALAEEASCSYTRIQALLLQNLAPTRELPRRDGEAPTGARTPRRTDWGQPPASGLIEQGRTLLGMLLRALRRLRPKEELAAVQRLLAARGGRDG
jgi:hypothetical protein